MPFEFALSEELKAEIIVLAKRDKTVTEAINKKIKQIIQSDEFTIDHYKNLRHDLSEYKRVHIMKSFVLLFKVYKEKNYILFDKFGHHDEIYGRKK
jgi:YafQ family addiction module toxin component